MIIHQLIDDIFEDRVSFVEFSLNLRKTTLHNVPRHPRYKFDWQCLVANFFKFFKIINLNMEALGLLPSTFIRSNRIDLRKVNKTISTDPAPCGIMFNLVYDNQLEYSFNDVAMNNLDIFDTSLTGFKQNKEIIEDYVDDTEQEFEYIRRQDYRNWEENNAVLNYPKSNLAYKSNYFMPFKQMVFTVSNKGIKEYIYNLNPDIASEKNLKTSDFKFEKYCYKNFLVFYQEKKDPKKVNIGKITLNIDNELQPGEFNKIYNLHDPASYTETLADILIKKYDLNNPYSIELRKIISEKRAPLVKASFVRALIKQYMNKESTFDDIIRASLSQQLEFGDLRLTETTKRDDVDKILSSVKDKSKLILATTSLKVEYQQIRALFGNNFDELLTGTIQLPVTKKKTYIKMIKLLIKHYKSKKKANETSLLRVINSLLECCKEGSLNNQGEIFESMLNDYLSTLKVDDEDEEDISEIDEPITSVKKFRIRFS